MFMVIGVADWQRQSLYFVLYNLTFNFSLLDILQIFIPIKLILVRAIELITLNNYAFLIDTSSPVKILVRY